MKLSLGPIQTYWHQHDVREFYEKSLEWPVDIYYLGEVVCSRRHEMRLDDWLDVAALLGAEGREVILSSQALLESESDLKRLRKLSDNGIFALEANDMSAVQLCQSRPFVAGPHLNIYNKASLDLLGELGAFRWIPQVELSGAQIREIHDGTVCAIETEVFAYGRLPLAFSSRCFTARYYDLPKDDCQFKCLEHPAGLRLKTREHKDFLVINGIQTQSAKIHCLLQEIAEMRAMGIGALRISPQPTGTGEILKAYRKLLDQEISSPDALMQIEAHAMDLHCNGYWHSMPGAHRATVA